MSSRNWNFEIYQDRSEQWRWRLVASNGRIVAVSSESYVRRAQVVQIIERLKTMTQTAPIVEDLPGTPRTKRPKIVEQSDEPATDLPLGQMDFSFISDDPAFVQSLPAAPSIVQPSNESQNSVPITIRVPQPDL